MGVDEAIDITAAERKTVLDLLDHHLPDTTAWVYGSRVKWTSRPQSDLDLVVFPTPAQRGRVGDLREAFDESDLPFRVDLFVWDDVPPSFRTQIDAEHVPLTRPARPSCPDGWVQRRLGDVIVLKRGYDLPERERRHGPVPVVSSSGITDHHSESRAPGPGVVTGRYGTLGQVFFVPNDFWPLNTALYVQDFKGNDPRFISYFLRSLDFSRFSDKAAVPGLNRNHLHEETVRIPGAVAEQRAIAHILGTLDDKIELNRQMNATLEAMARALFRSWFVDFDPVRAKMEGRDTGLPTHVADLFPDRLVDSELGDVPKGWRAGTLADIGRLNPEAWSNHHAPDRILYVDLAKTKWGYIENIQMYAWADAPSRARRVLRRGDTIVGTVRPGNASFALIDQDNLTGSTGFAVLRPTDLIDREIVYCAATSHDAIDRLAHLADGGAYPAVNPRAVLNTTVVLPDTGTRLAYSSLAAPLMDRLQQTQREARIFGTLRDALLPKLVSGEMRVGDTERLVGAIA